MTNYDVCGLGNALLDIEVNVSDKQLEKLHIDKGVMTLVDEVSHRVLMDNFSHQPQVRACGGSAANTMIAVQQLGCQGYYSCKVANDVEGEHFLDDLLSHGLRTNLMPHELEDGVTGKCFAMVTPDAERTMNTHLGVTEHFSITEVNEEVIKQSNFLYLEGYLVASDSAREAAIHARKIAEAAHVKTAITLSDPNMTRFFAEGLHDMIGEKIDLIFCNEQEALIFSGAKTLDAAHAYLEKLAHQFVVTRGKKGAMLFDGKEYHTAPESPAKVVDTLGAGDMFAGSYLASISQNDTPILAVKKANIAAAKVVSKYGPRLSDDEASELYNALKQLSQPSVLIV